MTFKIYNIFNYVAGNLSLFSKYSHYLIFLCLLFLCGLMSDKNNNPTHEFFESKYKPIVKCIATW